MKSFSAWQIEETTIVGGRHSGMVHQNARTVEQLFGLHVNKECSTFRFVSFRFVSFRFVGFDAGRPLVRGTY